MTSLCGPQQWRHRENWHHLGCPVDELGMLNVAAARKKNWSWKDIERCNNTYFRISYSRTVGAAAGSSAAAGASRIRERTTDTYDGRAWKQADNVSPRRRPSNGARGRMEWRGRRRRGRGEGGGKHPSQFHSSSRVVSTEAMFQQTSALPTSVYLVEAGTLSETIQAASSSAQPAGRPTAGSPRISLHRYV